MNKRLVENITQTVISKINEEIETFNKTLTTSILWKSRYEELEHESPVIIAINLSKSYLEDIVKDANNSEKSSIEVSINTLNYTKEQIIVDILRKEFGYIDTISYWGGSETKELESKLLLMPDDVQYDYNELRDNLIIWFKKEFEIYI